MAKESNRELKKQLTEAREDIQRLMLELGKVNKTANTSYEQSPGIFAIFTEKNGANGKYQNKNQRNLWT